MRTDGRVYYNEIDAAAVAWLRELMERGAISRGEIDTRSIRDVQPGDLEGFRRCHFFAGIGGWDYALDLADWPDDRDVWTGSCPCQPWSVAGKGAGADDPRHLWPAWFPLIGKRRPATVFGEQTAGTDGEYWLDLVLADMEGIDYAIGAFDLPVAGVGAPHGRPRLWIVADPNEARRGEQRTPRLREGSEEPIRDALRDDAHGRRAAGGNLADATRGGLQGLGGDGDVGHEPGWFGSQAAGSTAAAGAHRATFWSDVEWVLCVEPDGTEKLRPVEPGTFPLADGIPARVGRLRGYGNAINPWVAKEVIGAYLEIRE